MEKYIVKLTQEERENLIALTRRGKHAASKIMHARIILATDEGEFREKGTIKTDQQVAKELGINDSTVRRVRKLFVEAGLEEAISRKKHARTRPHKLTGDEEAHLIAVCCSSPPAGRNRWTLKLLAGRLVEMTVVETISPSTVGRVLKKMN